MTLNETEYKIVRLLARMRYSAARAAGVIDSQIADPDRYPFIDLNGFAAEVAFCKLANTYPDISIRPRAGGHDCVVSPGITVDVKTTSIPTGRLLVTTKKERYPCDVYALMIGAFCDFEFVGWIDRETIFADRRFTVFLSGRETFAVPQRDLYQPDKLL